MSYGINVDNEKQYLAEQYRKHGLLRHRESIPESILSSSSKMTAQPVSNLNISTLELHHKVEFVYPAIDLLAKYEEAVVSRPWHASERYQPLPLIADDHVSNHSRRDRLSEAAYCSLYKYGKAAFVEDVYSGNVFADVREALKYIGVTRLRILIYNSPAKHGLQIRIEKISTYRLGGGGEHKAIQVYDLKLETFSDAIPRDGGAWCQDLLRLIQIKDDVAARHVQWMLSSTGVRRTSKGAQRAAEANRLYHSFCASFKPYRQPSYGHRLGKIVGDAPKSLLPISVKTCCLCKKPFSKSDHLPHILPCCSAWVSKNCLVELCERDNLRHLAPTFEQPLCPSCNEPLFSSRALTQLRFGIRHGEYANDPRYTAWENFERSCADLDSKYASTLDETDFTVNAPILAKIWSHLLEHSVDPASPEHLQVNKYPEWSIVQDTVRKHTARIAGLPSSLLNLYNHLERHIWLSFMKRFHNSDLVQYFPTGDKAAIEQYLFRPGFKDFVARLLNRTLRFVQVRGCRTCGKESESGLHWHGGRAYYSKPEWEKNFEASRQVKRWRLTDPGQRYMKEFLNWVDAFEFAARSQKNEKRKQREE